MRAFGRMVEARKQAGKPKTFMDAQHVMDWYLGKTFSDKNIINGQVWFEDLEDAE